MHPNILDRNKTVLVVIDMQEPFLRGIFERDRVVSCVLSMVRAAKALDVSIVTTLQYQARMGDVIPELAEILPDSNRIDKTTFSCCGVETFIEQLNSFERRTAVICGVETHICVNQTALDLVEMGYKVHVPADAVSSRHETDWQIGLEKMRQSGVVITSKEMAIFELLRDAACPEFKQILELVK